MDQTINICVVTEYFYPELSGGSPTVISQLMRSLKNTHDFIEIDVLTSRNLYRTKGGLLPSSELWEGIHIQRLTTPKSNRPSTILRLLAGGIFAIKALFYLLCVSKKYDLLVVGTNPPTAPITAFLYRLLKNTPYVYIIHDLYPDLPIYQGIFTSKHPLAWIGQVLQRQWLYQAARVIVQGRCNREYLMRVYALPQTLIEVIPHWADENEISVLPKESQFRKAHSLEGFIVLYAGNLGPLQGLRNLLDSAKILEIISPDINIILVGSGSQYNELADQIISDRIANVKIFPAVCPAEYPDLLATADIAIVPLASGVDGLALPSKFYNHLASGRPVIAVVSENSEFAKALREDKCGWRVEQDNPAKLAECLHILSKSGVMLDNIGKNARRAFLLKYTLSHISEKYYTLLTNIVKSRS